MSRTVLLRNARIVLSDRTTERADLLIEGDRIARLIETSTERSAKDDSVLDLNGATLFPGFIDVHIHGAVGVDTMEATGNDLRQMAEFLARQGVTSWLPTLVPAPLKQYQQATGAIGEVMAQAPEPAARVLGVHYEGPFVNTQQCGALHREHFRTFTSVGELDELPVIDDRGAIHMMTLAPETEGGIDLISELVRRGWVVSIGHTRADLDVLDRARAAGARHMTHFMNAMTPLHHRTVGAAGWGLINDDVTCDLIADGIHIDRSILKLIVRHKTARRVSLISDSIAAAGRGDGEYEIWGETIVVKDGRTQNAHGSIAGSVITMLDAVRMMLSLGFSESEVARMASTNPAQLLGIDDDCGSIAEGKRADLVALDESLSVRATIVGGQIISH
jgi:N-acetylglucosamine-6-phosphate deacetylase